MPYRRDAAPAADGKRLLVDRQDNGDPRVFEAPPRPLLLKLLRTALFTLPFAGGWWRTINCLLVGAGRADACGPWGEVVKGAAFTLVYLGFMVGLPEWGDRRFVRRAEVLPDGLRVVTYRGSPIVLRWKEVVEVRAFRNKVLGGQRFRWTRVTAPPMRDVIFGDRLTGYDDLVASIHENTPRARRDGPLRFAERWLMGAKPA